MKDVYCHSFVVLVLLYYIYISFLVVIYYICKLIIIHRSVYQGTRRLNDFYAFQISHLKWSELAPRSPPAPRDRHSAVVYGHSFYVFGGFDGSSRVNDLHEYDLFLHKWRNIPSNDCEPSPRHSHSAVVYGSSMYIFAGYDGGYCNDLHQFNFQTKNWNQVVTQGTAPKGRYRCSTVVYKDHMIIHGGHDGTSHLEDAHIYNFTTSVWSSLDMYGPMPHPRDSHCAIIFEHSMIIFGGSNGSPLDDFHELNLISHTWRPIVSNHVQNDSKPFLTGSSPNSPNRRRDVRFLPDEPIRRFCHTGVVYDDTLFLFGGYDGVSRLNDLKRYRFPREVESLISVPSSTLHNDLRSLVNTDVISDVTFIVEGRSVRAHRILCLRSPFFKNMLTGEYLESR
jgi:leucine-zipper-like transcriptional regulator 1